MVADKRKRMSSNSTRNKITFYIIACAVASILSLYISGRWIEYEGLTGKALAVWLEGGIGAIANLTWDLAENSSVPMDHAGRHPNEKAEAVPINGKNVSHVDRNIVARMRSLSSIEIAELSPPPLEVVKMRKTEKVFLQKLKRMRNEMPYKQLEHVGVVQRFYPDKQSFPQPKLVHCDDVNFCEFENVCVASFSGTLLFTSPSNVNLTRYTDEIFKKVKPANAGQVLRKLALPHRMGHMYFAETIFSVNCWKQKRNARNPAHLMIGLGNMFYIASRMNQTLPKDALIIYHQCPNIEGWSWGSSMERLLWDYGHESGFIGVPYAERTRRRVILPLVGGTKGPIICGRRFLSILETGYTNQNWMVDNKPPVINAWRSFIHDKFGFVPEPSRTKVSATENRTCQDNLQIAVWRREGGSRRLRYEADVANLAAEYVDKPVVLLTAGGKTPFAKQVANFRSFDILVTPHGSHLTNLLFTKENAALIEVIIAKIDFSFQKNGRPLLRYSNFSAGHKPFKYPKGMSEKRVEEEMNNCNSKRCPQHAFGRFLFLKNADVAVNINILRKNMEDAIVALCGSVHLKRDLH